MLKLIKYEFIRRLKVLAVAAAVLAILQGGTLFGIYKGDKYILLALLLISIMIYGSLIMIIVDTIRNYSIDLNQKQGYMLFLTPNSGHKIIISKLLATTIILTVGSAIIFTFLYWDFTIFKDLYISEIDGELKEAFDMIISVYGGAMPNLASILLILGQTLVEFTSFIVTIIFSITIRKTILSNTRYGGFISFLIFCAVFSVLSTVNMGATFITGTFGDYMEMVQEMAATEVFDTSQFATLLRRMIAVESFMHLIYIGVFTFFSGKLLNTRVDL